MVRTAFLGRINKELNDHHFFSGTDFDIDVDNVLSEITITYRFDERYKFHIDLSPGTGSANAKITAREAPGEVGDEDHIGYRDSEELLTALTQWMDRLHEELKAIPVYRAIEDQRRQLAEFFTQYGNVQDEYFTRDEADEVNLRLSNLEAQLIQTIKASALSEVQAQRKIEQLEKEMAVLREKVDVLKKPAFVTSLFTNIWEWSKDPSNRKVLASGASTVVTVAKGVLEATGHELPQLPSSDTSQ
jgi:hypothetical protein